jgi:hypothetical protein
MCIAPVMIPSVGLVACRSCWQCETQRKNDLIGRAIAEQQKSTKTFALTLTYAGDETGSALLIYEHFQKFMKSLRRDGYNVRYIVAGEYGSKKQRAHWHAILFFRGKVPEVPLETRFEWKYWQKQDVNGVYVPRGFVYFQEPDYKGFAYVLKYALKDQSQQTRVGHLAMSKKPPLGHEFFMDMAEDHVRHKLSPQGGFYSFRNIFDSKGERRQFMLTGRMRELYVKRFIRRWREVHGTEYPLSEFVERNEDRLIRSAEMALWWPAEKIAEMFGELPEEPVTIERLNAEFWAKREPRPKRKPEPHYDLNALDENGQAVKLSECATYVVRGSTEASLTVYSDGSIGLSAKGIEPWRIANVRQLERALELLGLTARQRLHILQRWYGEHTPAKRSG